VDIPAWVTDEVSTLLKSCVQFEPAKRPDFKSILEIIEQWKKVSK
jgi:hypothetical protein